MKKIRDGWIIHERTLYLQEYDVLIVSDIHFGKCISDTNRYNEKYTRLKNKIDNLKPDTLILNGDTFYCSSDYFNNQLKEDKYIFELLQKLRDSVNKCIILKGNHELVLSGFTKKYKKQFNIKDYYIIDDILIHHGHKIDKSLDKINHHIIGHIHPTKNKKPVFHYSKNGFKNKSVTILPAFCKHVNTVEIKNYSGLCPLFEKGIGPENYKTIS